MSDLELTQTQIERQDLVNNAVFELLQMVNPTDKEVNWDIEVIGGVRDVVAEYFTSHGFCSEQDFYPALPE